jgi:hypothetical protein
LFATSDITDGAALAGTPVIDGTDLTVTLSTGGLTVKGGEKVTAGKATFAAALTGGSATDPGVLLPAGAVFDGGNSIIELLATGTPAITIKDTAKLTIADGILRLPNTDFKAGKYVATGDVKVKAQAPASGDTIALVAGGSLAIGTPAFIFGEGGTGTTYTLMKKNAADGDRVELDGSAAGAVTVPADASVGTTATTSAITLTSAAGTGAALKGAGTVTFGMTEISGGNGGWMANDTGTPDSVKISGTATKTTIAAASGASLVAGQGAAITQKLGGSSELEIAAATVIALGGTAGNGGVAVGTITLKAGTANAAKLSLANNTSSYITGCGANQDTGPVNSTTGLMIGGGAVTVNNVGLADFQVTPGGNGFNYLSKLGGNAAGDIKAGTTASDSDIVIAGNSIVTSN